MKAILIKFIVLLQTIVVAEQELLVTEAISSHTRHRAIFYGYDDCSDAAPLSRSYPGCGVPILAFSCEGLNEGGQKCLARCLTEESCDFFSIVFDDHTSTCRCSMRTTESLISSTRVVYSTEDQIPSKLPQCKKGVEGIGSFHCDNSHIKDKRIQKVVNCDGDTGCAYHTTKGYTVAKVADNWSLVDTCTLRVSQALKDMVKKSRAKGDDDEEVSHEEQNASHQIVYEAQAASHEIVYEAQAASHEIVYEAQAASHEIVYEAQAASHEIVYEAQAASHEIVYDEFGGKIVSPGQIVQDEVDLDGDIVYPGQDAMHQIVYEGQDGNSKQQAHGRALRDLLKNNFIGINQPKEDGPGLFGYRGEKKAIKKTNVKNSRFPNVFAKKVTQDHDVVKDEHNVTAHGEYKNVTGDIHDVITANFTDVITMAAHSNGTGTGTFYNTGTDNGCPADCPCKCKKKGTCDCEIEVDIEVEAVIDVNMPDCSDNDREDCGGGCNGKKFKSD